MTTKQIAGKSAGTTENHAGEVHDQSAPPVEDVTRDLLAKARYDAFRLVTEAREEAENSLEEARTQEAGIVKAARITADATAQKADAAAKATVIAAKEEVAAIVASAHRTAGEQTMGSDAAALEVEHRELSHRVSTLRDVAEQLEARFAALALTAAGPPPGSATSDPVESDTELSAPPLTHPRVAIDYSPSVSPPEKDDETEAKKESDSDETNVERDSFYHRRSASLPSLGEDGGRSALDMTRSMRASLESD
ncbi:MAG: hypothetical protein QGM46_10270 [Actinomycetota bacterium]|nr:hypothetical protein [Actinomycetota bacterium]MDK1017118.1 hypothetical protein [Actinomycetota bacterium]MDK1027081.1 hypothetical protein [Actinomycetota bacterium]MDK1039453.1 hypothetical protein [Actinomycetota bacterium]MDK1097607.1 hypothetical protein [Actinomycetota bacterium]